MPQLPHAFKEITRTSYAADHLTGLRVEGGRHEVVLSGICPRCRHPFQFVHPLSGFRGLRPARPGDTYTVQVACLCAVEHPDCPEDDEGCGAYWVLLLRRSA